MASKTRRKGALVVVALAILMATASSTFALDITHYMPHSAGNQWSYINTNNVTMSQTMGSPVTLPSGVSAIPWTSVDSSQSGYTETYNTIDANGFRKHQEYASSVYISGYGNTSANVVYSPALSVLPGNVTVGSTYSSTSIATLTYTNVTTVALNCNMTTQVVGFENVSSNDGSQSWSALTVISSMTLSGTINGQFTSISSVWTLWLVDGLGIVQMYRPNVSLQMETWKLKSTNVTVPTTTTTTTKSPTTTTTSTTTTMPPNGSVLHINIGWNLLSSTIGLQATDFGDNGTYTSVWKWVDGAWAVYLPGEQPLGSYANSKGFSQFTSLNPGEGFWVNATGASTLTIPGTPVGGDLTLANGWNLVGLKSAQSTTVVDFIADNPGIISLWKWENGTWAVSLPDEGAPGAYAASKGFSLFADIEPGEGLWVNVPTVTSKQTVLWKGLEWQKSGSQTDMNWDAANAYCTNLTEGGYDDWDLPSINTLKSLIVCSNGTQVTFGPDN